MDPHERFMKRCYELAEMARAKGESPVGSIIVRDGIIIGEGIESSRSLDDITRHAEVMAILDAVHKHGKEDCEGAWLYSNVEPCLLCSYVIRHHRIAQVIFDQHCGELGGTNQKFNLLETNKIKSWGRPPVIRTYHL